MSSPCIYCALDAYNVIEVRYARTIKATADARVADEDLPREIIGRGYYVCDGCLRLLDYHVEHHLEPRRQARYNAAMAFYMLFVVWGMAAIASLAGKLVLLRDPRFLTTGAILGLSCLLVWLLRVSIHSRYVDRWKKPREKPVRPSNSLHSFTTLRDRVNRELGAYLPVRFEDSVRLAALDGSPPIRSLGPGGETWGAGPETNFPGRGDNEWYRLVWISWQLWPLSKVHPPQDGQWVAPPESPVAEIEVGAATFLAAFGTAAATFGMEQGPLVGLLAGLILAPIGWFIGRQARQFWRQRQEEKYGGPAVPGA